MIVKLSQHVRKLIGIFMALLTYSKSTEIQMTLQISVMQETPDQAGLSFIFEVFPTVSLFLFSETDNECMLLLF